MSNIETDIYHILVSEQTISETVERIAKQIDRDYADKNLLLVCILKGSVVFFSDLMRKLTIPLEIDFMKVSSYGDRYTSNGKPNFTLKLQKKDLSDSDILIIEDIIDSGRTLSSLVDDLKENGAKSIKTCTFLDKPSRREVPYTPDYVGYVIDSKPDDADQAKFVVGYGLDYNEKYRELPYIGLLKPEVYTNK